jgi:hypothetical protein
MAGVLKYFARREHTLVRRGLANDFPGLNPSSAQKLAFPRKAIGDIIGTSVWRL